LSSFKVLRALKVLKVPLEELKGQLQMFNQFGAIQRGLGAFGGISCTLKVERGSLDTLSICKSGL
jgi:hypothetical protein